MEKVGEEELRQAAGVLLGSALRVVAGERFVVVGDLESVPLVTALEATARALSAEVSTLRLDLLKSTSTNHSGERPHKVLPDAVRRAMLSAQASAFVANAPHAETSMRDQLAHIVSACKVRHAHMAGVSALAFSRGLRADHGRIADASRALLPRLENAKEIVAESAEGTQLVIKGSACKRWVARAGRVSAGQSVSFPTGSIIASPEQLSGTFAATASLGEYFGAKAGRLTSPVTFEIVDGRVIQVDAAPGNDELVRDIETMLRVAAGSDRVGLVVLGLNAGIGEPTGDASVDQHRPGLHLVFGDPQGRMTGATWSARTTFAACQAGGTVRIDGVELGTDGTLSA